MSGCFPKIPVVDKTVTVQCSGCGQSTTVEVIQHKRDGAYDATKWTNAEVISHMRELVDALCWHNKRDYLTTWHTARELVEKISPFYPGIKVTARLSEAVGCDIMLVNKETNPPKYRLNIVRVKEVFSY